VWAFKKIASRLVFPVPLCLEILLIGLILLWLTKRQKTGKLFVTLGTVLLALFSNGAVSNWLLEPLEVEYPALQNPPVAAAGVRWIAVLGSGYSCDPSLSPSARPEPESLMRLVEGVRLQRLLPGSKLIASAEFCSQPEEAAKNYAALTELLGLQKDNFVVAEGARDTADEVKLIQNSVAQEPFILVTSASHLPRAMAMFQDAGMHPIAAPTHNLVRRDPDNDPSSYFPSAGSLRKSERAVYEYLGQAWAKLTK
jgi:uncharacterized SAM-binding protein YcdF (DUF218 family)